jgi:hypothetical protein
MNVNCDCGNVLTTENDLKRGYCFGCHVKSIRLGFKHGKENFHGPTIREQQRFYEDSQKFKDGKITKVPDRAKLI